MKLSFFTTGEKVPGRGTTLQSCQKAPAYQNESYHLKIVRTNAMSPSLGYNNLVNLKIQASQLIKKLHGCSP